MPCNLSAMLSIRVDKRLNRSSSFCMLDRGGAMKPEYSEEIEFCLFCSATGATKSKRMANRWSGSEKQKQGGLSQTQPACICQPGVGHRDVKSQIRAVQGNLSDSCIVDRNIHNSTRPMECNKWHRCRFMIMQEHRATNSRIVGSHARRVRVEQSRRATAMAMA